MTPAGQLLHRQFRLVHQMLEAGAATALVPYARALLSEDLTVNCMLAGGKPLALSTWASHVRMDLDSLGSYAKAVYASTDAYLSSLSEEDLDPMARNGPACLLSALLLTHARRAGQAFDPAPGTVGFARPKDSAAATEDRRPGYIDTAC